MISPHHQTVHSLNAEYVPVTEQTLRAIFGREHLYVKNAVEMESNSRDFVHSIGRRAMAGFRMEDYHSIQTCLDIFDLDQRPRSGVFSPVPSCSLLSGALFSP